MISGAIEQFLDYLSSVSANKKIDRWTTHLAIDLMDHYELIIIP